MTEALQSRFFATALELGNSINEPGFPTFGRRSSPSIESTKTHSVTRWECWHITREIPCRSKQSTRFVCASLGHAHTCIRLAFAKKGYKNTQFKNASSSHRLDWYLAWGAGVLRHVRFFSQPQPHLAPPLLGNNRAVSFTLRRLCFHSLYLHTQRLHPELIKTPTTNTLNFESHLMARHRAGHVNVASSHEQRTHHS